MSPDPAAAQRARDVVLESAYTKWAEIESKAPHDLTPGEEYFVSEMRQMECRCGWLRGQRPDGESTAWVSRHMDDLETGMPPPDFRMLVVDRSVASRKEERAEETRRREIVLRKQRETSAAATARLSTNIAKAPTKAVGRAVRRPVFKPVSRPARPAAAGDVAAWFSNASIGSAAR